MYTYNAKVIKVVDGDTLDALVDLGFDTWKQVRIRMMGINTPGIDRDWETILHNIM